MVSSGGISGSIGRPSWLKVCIIATIFSAVLCTLSPTTVDPDLWGHIKYGHDLWQTGKVVRGDVYSYLSGSRPWINHEWLSELIFFGICSAFGSLGLIALKLVLGLIIAWLVYRHLRLQGLLELRAGMILLLAFLSFAPRLATVRPQIFTHLLWLLVVLVILQVERGRPAWLWLLPAVFAVWVNLHGGFLVGIGILGIWALFRIGGDLISTRNPSVLFSPPNSFIIASLTASLFATFLNPYGPKLMLFLLKTATVPRPRITEWQPLSLMSLFGVLYLVLLGVASTGLIGSARKRTPALIAIFICVALLPFTASRHIAVSGLAVVVLAGEHIANTWERLSPGDRGFDGVSGKRRLLIGVYSLAIIALLGWSVRTLGCIRFVPKQYPVRAVALLKQSRVSGNMAVFFNWGQYVLWHLGPRVRVSVDGRRETVYSDEIYEKNVRFTFGLDEWDALIREHETDMALVSKTSAGFNLMKLMPGWALVYQDPVCGLFVREGSPQIKQLRNAPVPDLQYDGAGLCFRCEQPTE